MHLQLLEKQQKGFDFMTLLLDLFRAIIRLQFVSNLDIRINCSGKSSNLLQRLRLSKGIVSIIFISKFITIRILDQIPRMSNQLQNNNAIDPSKFPTDSLFILRKKRSSSLKQITRPHCVLLYSIPIINCYIITSSIIQREEPIGSINGRLHHRVHSSQSSGEWSSRSSYGWLSFISVGDELSTDPNQLLIKLRLFQQSTRPAFIQVLYFQQSVQPQIISCFGTQLGQTTNR